MLVYHVLYEGFLNGTISYYGNSIGLAGSTGTLTPGTTNNIKCFITMDTLSQASAAWPTNTTFDWKLNSSDAFVEFEKYSTVEKAFLMWGATYAGIGGALTSSPVWLQDPGGLKHSITPDHNILNSHSTNTQLYFNSADVTTIVQNAGSGQYICGSIPCSMVASPSAQQTGGWTLAIAFKNKLYSTRYAYIILNNQDSPGGGGAPYPVKFPAFGVSRVKFCASILGAIPTNNGFGFGYFSGYTRPSPFSDAYNVISSSWRPNTSNQHCNVYGSVIDKHDSSGPVTDSLFVDRQPSLIPPTTYISGARSGLDILNQQTYGTNVSQLQLDLIQNSFSLSFGYIADATNALPFLTKTVDKTIGHSGDTLVYTLTVFLEGLTDGSTRPKGDASNVMVFDTIPFGTTFIPNSVQFNGVTLPNVNPQTGITIGYVLLPYVATINYSVTIDNPVPVTSIPNEFFITFTSTLIGNTTLPLSSYSNTVTTEIPPLGISKISSKDFADLGDTITYTLLVSNSSSTPLTNVTVFDTISNLLTLNSGSLTLNGLPIIGDLSTGLNIGTIPGNSVSTITFNTKTPLTIPLANTIPNIALAFDSTNNTTNSNQVLTTISSGKLTINKISSKPIIPLGDTISYTLIISNIGNVDNLNPILIDTLPSEVTLMPNSTYINNSLVNGTILPPNGLSIGTITPNTTKTITFIVKSTSLPAINPISNKASLISTYYTNPTIPTNYNIESNIAQTSIVGVIIDTCLKTVNKTYALIEDILTYTITLKNSGNIVAKNSTFIDTISNALSYIPNTLKINGIQTLGTPNNIFIGDIPPNGLITITYNCAII
ncbi:MAG: hypothetical protein ACRC30_09225 [Clostridium sp.]